MDKELLEEINQMRLNIGLQLFAEDFSNILTENEIGPEIKEFINIIFNKLKPGGKSVLKTLVNDEENILIKQYFKDTLKSSNSADKIKFNEFIKSPNGKTFISELKKQINITAAKGIKEESTIRYWRSVVEEMEQGVKLHTLDTPIDVIKALTNEEKNWLKKTHGSGWKNFFSPLYRMVDAMFKSETALLEQTLKIMKEIVNNPEPSTIAMYRKKISDNFDILTKMRTDNFEGINRWVGDNVPKELRERLSLEKLNGYKKAKKLSSGESKIAFDKAYGNFNTRRHQVRSQLKDLTFANKERVIEKYKSKSKMRTEFWKLAQVSENKFAELKSELYIGTSMSPKASQEYIKTFGLGAYSWKYAKEYIYMTAVFDVVIALFDEMTDMLSKSLADLKVFRNVGWVQNQAQKYEKYYFRSKNSPTFNFLESLVGYEEKDKVNRETADKAWNVTKISLLYVKDEVFSWHAVFPGFIDDIVLMIIDMWDWFSLPTTKLTPEQEDDVIKKGDILQERARVIQDSLNNRKIKLQEAIKKDSIQNSKPPVDGTDTNKQQNEFGF